MPRDKWHRLWPSLDAEDVYPTEATERTAQMHSGCRLPCETSTEMTNLLTSEEEEQRAVALAKAIKLEKELGLPPYYGKRKKG